MKIAIPSDQGQVAAHFGHCASFEIYEIEANRIVEEQSLPNPGHQPGFLPNFLHEQGVTVIIAGGIGMAAVRIFEEKGIKVVPGASGSSRSAVEQYLKGELDYSGSVCEH